MVKKISLKTQELITLLNNQTTSVNGGTTLSELGNQLGISRTAVWKKIKELQALDGNLIQKTTQGYRLTQPITLLNSQFILAALDPSLLRASTQLDIHLSLPSTNDYLKKIVAESVSHGSIKPRKAPFSFLRSNHQQHSSDNNQETTMLPLFFCLAEQQTAGRSRLGRTWHSPFGVNIYSSSYWHFNKDLSELGGLSLAVSLAIINTLKEYGIQQPLYVKWPNDIFCNDKKMGGILIDAISTAHQSIETIIGIGLNINMQTHSTLPDPIGQPWTSLQEITGHWHDRNHLVGLLIGQLWQAMKAYQKDGLSAFLQQWHTHDYLRGKEIVLQHFDKSYQGEVLGIDKHGHLLLKQANGLVTSFAVGEASLHRAM